MGISMLILVTERMKLLIPGSTTALRFFAAVNLGPSYYATSLSAARLPCLSLTQTMILYRV